jgi:hypothetical protein
MSKPGTAVANVAKDVKTGAKAGGSWLTKPLVGPLPGVAVVVGGVGIVGLVGLLIRKLFFKR